MDVVILVYHMTRNSKAEPCKEIIEDGINFFNENAVFVYN